MVANNPPRLRPRKNPHRLVRRESGQRGGLGAARKEDCCKNTASIPRSSAISASPIVLQALLAGEIDVAATSVATLVSSRLAGADTVMILGMVRTFVDHIITAQNITRPEQLKGKIGGVNRIGSTSDLGLRFALRRLGIDPDKDAKVITAGGNPERFAALSKGVINFTIIPEPFVRQALQLGFRDLFDIGSLKIPFWWNSVLSREAIVKAKRPLLVKFARAMIEAIHFNKTHKEESKAIWGKYLKVTDQEGLERAWQAYTAAYPDNLLPTPEGVKTALDDLAPRDPRAAAADAQSFRRSEPGAGNRSTGFIKQLYKK